jgi:large subunit ribosomal protein L25
MKTVEIKGTSRASIGKKETKALRNEGLVPCVLYGGGENVHFSVDEKEVNTLLYTPNAHIVALNIDGKTYKAVIQDSQFHAVSDRTIHLDFVRISDDKKVAIDVPITVIGSSEGVKQGGKLQLLFRKIRVSALPANLPDSVVVDITGLEMGQSKFVGSIATDNYDILTPKTAVVATVKMTRAARGAAATDGKK